jgi:hypothetical protein
VALLLSLGIAIAPGVSDNIILVIVVLMGIIQAVWTRGGVTPNAKVVAYLPDPFESSAIVAGDATTTATDNNILVAAKSAGGTQ